MNENNRWLVGLALWLGGVGAAAAEDYDREPIHYATASPNNAVSRLDARLARGEVKLEYHKEFGYLASLLRELKVSVSSQTLVFSRTSLQRRRISPSTPRAIYFNDEAYVGYCREGDVLEVSVADTRLGTVFYTLDQKADSKPRFARHNDTCLLCHSNSRTHGVPGHVVRSVYPDPRGEAILSGFGGWYVTGTHGKQRHLGNLIIRTRGVEHPVENRDGLNLTDLGKRFDRKAYPSAHSDIVAHLVLAHQTQAQNLITVANFNGRQALHREEELNRETKMPAGHRWESTTVRIRSAGDDLLKYLLFCEEVPLGGKVKGTSSFADDFAKAGPRDSKGRSLRDFDLRKRLFKYPCSYLIYSEAFDALPGPVRDYVLERLWKVLTGRDRSKEFAHLSAADRKAIHEIVAATKLGLPAYWRGR